MNDPASTLRRLIYGFRTTQLIYVAAQLGLADELRGGARSAQSLADAVGADPRALRRVLRALASDGIFSETPDGRFEATPMSELLRADAGSSMRDIALLYGPPWLWRAYGDLLHSVRSGEPAFAHVHGEPFYAFLQHHADEAAAFNRAMSSFTAHEESAIAAACDLSQARSIVDVGGGHGALVAALLQRHRGLRGVVFDVKDVVAGAARALDDAGLADRCECVAGDFFAGVPSGGDVYLLKSVLHNWDDEAATRILVACRHAMHEHARLVIAERVIAPGPGPSEAKLFDINMMVTVGGMERTRAEYAVLLQAAGLRLQHTQGTESPLSLLEAVRPASR